MHKEIWTYLGNQLGFSQTGRIILYEHIMPSLTKIGVNVFEPFQECAQRIGFSYARTLSDYDERRHFLNQQNRLMGSINKDGMKKCQMMSPVLDGGHIVDDGVANGIGHYAAKRYGKIIALRTDLRLAENIGAAINPQIESDIEESNGRICTAMDEWYAEIEKEYKRLGGRRL